MLASAGTDVSLWEIGRDEPLQQLQEHGAPVSSLRWTSNDRVLGSASHDGSILLIESDGNMFDTLRPVPNEPSVAVPVLSLSWSPGSRYLAAGCNDATVRVFDLQRRVQALQLRGHRAGVGAVAWNPNELHVASASSAGEIVMHRVQGSVAAVSRATHPKLEEDTLPPAVSCLQWAPFEPTKLACAAEDGQVSLWDMEVEAQSSSPSTCFAEHADSCSGLAWSLISHHVLASCSEDSTALLYDTKIGSVVRRFNADVALTALAFAADGVHLACVTPAPALGRPRPSSARSMILGVVTWPGTDSAQSMARSCSTTCAHPSRRRSGPSRRTTSLSPRLPSNVPPRGR